MSDVQSSIETLALTLCGKDSLMTSLTAGFNREKHKASKLIDPSSHELLVRPISNDYTGKLSGNLLQMRFDNWVSDRCELQFVTFARITAVR